MDKFTKGCIIIFCLMILTVGIHHTTRIEEPTGYYKCQTCCYNCSTTQTRYYNCDCKEVLKYEYGFSVAYIFSYIPIYILWLIICVKNKW